MMLYFFMWSYGFSTDESIVVDDSPHMAHHLDCVPDINIGMGEEARIITGSIWPSPAREQITVTTSALGAELRLIDIGGRVVLRQRISSGQQQIGVSPLARGLYTVELVGDGAPWRTKVLLE